MNNFFRGVTVLILLSVECAHAQVSPATIRTSLEKYYSDLPEEKIYLHLDKPYYAPGDTIWLKAYLVEGNTNLPDTVSKNIHVDLHRKNDGKQVARLLLRNETGSAPGWIKLADSLKEDAYEIRAYTQWMRNFSEESFFHKEFFVRSLYSAKSKFTESEITAWGEVADLQFFPEGGYLVEGLPGRVAFKAVNKFGKGVDIKAFIVSSGHDTIAAIQSQHLGMGHFTFTPKRGEKYFTIQEKRPNSKPFYLPEPLKQGYTFLVDNLRNKDEIMVSARNNYPFKDRPMLIGHVRGKVVLALQSEAEGNSFTWKIPRTEILEEGIVHLTLFNSNGGPQCERLIYNDLEMRVKTTLRPDKEEYRTRQKVEVSVQVRDDEGNPVEGDLSVAVTDTNLAVPETNGDDLYNYLYLSSDVPGEGVKGHIEQPGYYFKDDPTAKVHLDILLMTQGWRKFSWPNILKNTWQGATYGIEKGIHISGKASVNKNNAEKPVDITMFYNSKGESVYRATKTDDTKKFSFDGINLYGEAIVFLQATKENRGRNIVLSSDSVSHPLYLPSNRYYPIFADADQMNVFLDRQKYYTDLEARYNPAATTVLKEVSVTARKEHISDSRKVFYEGSHYYTVKVSEDNRCAQVTSALQLLQGRVPGINVVQDSDGWNVTSARVSSIRGANKMVILVDGMITDAQYVGNGVPRPCDVESIEVVTQAVAMLNALGLVSILTKRGNSNYDWTKEKVPGTLTLRLLGYNAPREFYSPKYPVADVGSENNSTLDLRSTLYWNPSVKTDAEGKAKIAFWTTDEKTTIRIDLQGMSSDGRPTNATLETEVK
ncbi:MAG: TonB-dependent receptor plug domain-containing protein [Bacteroidetes bacterium]|nr:TonB-dependent receptor plug domain-containing protein [Bacteroidota bacterium]